MVDKDQNSTDFGGFDSEFPGMAVLLFLSCLTLLAARPDDSCARKFNTKIAVLGSVPDRRRCIKVYVFPTFAVTHNSCNDVITYTHQVLRRNCKCWACIFYVEFNTGKNNAVDCSYMWHGFKPPHHDADHSTEEESLPLFLLPVWLRGDTDPSHGRALLSWLPMFEGPFMFFL